MPANNAVEMAELNRQLEQLGPEVWSAIIDMLVPPGTGDDTYARYALNGLAKFASRPGSGSFRSSYEQVILDALQSERVQPPDKTFLMAQLELMGSNSSVDVLRSLLDDKDKEVRGAAARCLTSIGTDKAFGAVFTAVENAAPERQAVLIKTVGDARLPKAADELMSYARSNNEAVHEAALYALAQSGNPSAAPALQDIRFQANSFPTIKHTSLRLLYARRLLEEGHDNSSRSICMNILNSDAPANVKNNALSLLVDQRGTGAMDEIIRASTSDDPKLRESALEIAATLKGPGITERWIDLLDKQQPEVQADILVMLGNRSDKKALPQVLEKLNSKNIQVRLAAVDASARLGGGEAIPDLVRVLAATDDNRIIKQIKGALLRLPTDEATQRIAQKIDEASGPSKVAMIEILGERRASSHRNKVFAQISSNDSSVRLAALKVLGQVATEDDLDRMIDWLPKLEGGEEQRLLKEAVGSVVNRSGDSSKSVQVVLDKIHRAPVTQKAQLLSLLPQLPADETLKILVQNTKNSDNEVKRAAVSALADWPYAPAVDPLLQFLQHSDDADIRSTALSGYLRLIGELKFSSEDKVERFAQALKTAQNTTEKQMVLSALADVSTASAVELAAHYFQDEDVQDRALKTVAHILATQNADGASMNSGDVAAAMTESMRPGTIHQKLKKLLAEERRKVQESREFTTLFNGRDLSGWIGATDAYEVNDGMIEVKPNTHGNLFTEDRYRNFVFRFEFKLTPGANNGLGIRAPLEGDPAYQAMEIQILDNTGDKFNDSTAENYYHLHKYQYHGSIYGVVPAKQGYLKPVGEWNREEVTADGSHITVKLNGETIVDADLDTVTAIDGREHPGLHRQNGHIGFLGHGDKVYFRNIRVKNLDRYAASYGGAGSSGHKINKPPKGFRALFNGRNLEGWKGLVGNPETRAKMSKEELARKQVKADSVMRKHWSVHNGILYFDGNGESLTTKKKYGDFEMLVDWKINPHGDSGIYLRGSPQVQIWDITQWPQGSGGLYNNKKHQSDPMVAADNVVGEWNNFRIRMIDGHVTVHLNGQLVVSNVVMENYWNRDKPIYPVGQIELQSHTTPLYFKNIFMKEIPRTQDLFNGKNLTGWERVGGQAGGWKVEDGILSTEGGGEEWKRGMGGGWLSTDKEYDNFKLELEYRLPEGGNSGVFLRAPQQGDPAFAGMEIQLLDDYAQKYSDLEPWQYTGSIYDVKAPSERVTKKAGEWQKMTIVCDGPKVKVTLNGKMIIDTSLVDHMDRVDEHPGLKRRSGYIGLQNHNTKIEFRNIKIKELK